MPFFGFGRVRVLFRPVLLIDMQRLHLMLAVNTAQTFPLALHSHEFQTR